VSFIEHSINAYVNKKDKTIQFCKNAKKSFPVNEIHINEKVTSEMFDVWLCNDLVEILIEISETNQAKTVRKILETPIQIAPELLLLTLAKIRPRTGNLLIDELMSIMMPSILGNH
jgi:hypothetical protein